MDESTLFQNIFETGRDPHEWLREYIFYFADSSGILKVFPDWFEKFNTGYQGFGIDSMLEGDGDNKNLREYIASLYTNTGDVIWTPGRFSRPVLATMEAFIQLRDCINLKIWLTEYVKANVDATPTRMENNLFPGWWIEKVNPNWTEWSVFYDSECNLWSYWIEGGLSAQSGTGIDKKSMISGLVNFIWDEVESVKFKEIK